MSLERTTHLLVGVLVAIAVLSASSLAIASAAAADVAQTNETANATTTNDSAVNTTLGNLTVWTAPGDEFANLSSPAAVQAAKRDDWLTRNRTVAEGDTVVFGLPAPGLASAVAAANGTDSDAAAFVQVLDRSDLYEFRVEQTPETSGTESLPKELNRSATLAAGALRVVPDERDGSVYVALRTDRAVLDYGGDRELSFEDGEDYRVNLTVTADDATTSSTVELEIVHRGVTFGDSNSDPVTFHRSRACVPVSGDTPIAPGTELPVVLRQVGGSTVVATDRVTVTSSGRFSTCLDTSGVSNETLLEVGVRGLPDYDTPVVGTRAELPSVTVETESNGTVVVTTRAFRWGSVLLYLNDTRVDGSDVFDSGVHTVRFDRPERDGRLTAVFSDSGRDEPCALSDGDAPDCASDTLVIGDRTDTPTTPNATDTSSSITTAPSRPTTTTHGDGPGFDPVAAALALLTVALLVGRRS